MDLTKFWYDLKEVGNAVVDLGTPFKDLGKETIEIASEAVDEFCEDPIDYTIESAKDISKMALQTATLPVRPAYNAVEGFIDNVVRDKVFPVRGSVLYVDLAFGYIEHSGIYVGDNQIIELDSDGDISLVSPKEFISGGTGISIYVSCEDEWAVGSEIVAERAEQMLGEKKKYNLIFNNCHMFSAACLTGDFENVTSFLDGLKVDCKSHLNANTWRVWDIDIF